MSRKLPKATALTMDDLKSADGATKASSAASETDGEPVQKAAAPAARPKRSPAARAKAAASAPKSTAAKGAATPDTDTMADFSSDAPRSAPPEAPSSAESSDSSGKALREARAREIVERYAAYAAVGGIIPLPLLDTVSVFAVQIEMVRALSRHYRVEFRRDRARAAVAAVATTLGQLAAGALVSTALARITPGAGLIGLASSSVAALALARTIGLTFVEHFEEGGTGAVFDLEHLRAKARTVRETTPKGAVAGA